MDTAYWHERWLDRRIGFHRDDYNPLLEKYWPALQVSTGTKVFVPLCGKALDMLWLAEQGYEVLGVECSPIPVQEFFRENGLQPTETREQNFIRWQAGLITILQGDFFSLTSTELADCQACYDRASLVALPPAMRNDYAQHLLKFPGVLQQMLLITMEYDQSRADGPPYSVGQQEVYDYYSGSHRIALLHEAEIIDEMRGLQKAGVESVIERVLKLRTL